MFPSIGVAAKPEKGSVVFWHNKDPTGNKILESKHGGCPVLYGVKWGKLEYCLKVNLILICFGYVTTLCSFKQMDP